MAKYIFTRPNGPWQYPTLGITATLNDVIEANAAPDLWWELTDSGATVTLPAIPAIPGVVEPLDGAIGRWNRQTNEVEFVAQLPDENLPDRLQEAALASTFVAVRTSDGHPLAPGTIVVITLDKTLAEITATPVADIADITFEEA